MLLTICALGFDGILTDMTQDDMLTADYTLLLCISRTVLMGC